MIDKYTENIYNILLSIILAVVIICVIHLINNGKNTITIY